MIINRTNVILEIKKKKNQLNPTEIVSNPAGTVTVEQLWIWILFFESRFL